MLMAGLACTLISCGGGGSGEPSQTSSPQASGSPAPTGSPTPSASPAPSATPMASASPTAAPTMAVAYDWSGLISTLDGYVGNSPEQIAGYSFAMNVAGRKVLSHGGGDLSDNSRVAIASATKAAAAAALLSLVDEGLVDLDTPVGTYIGTAINWPADKVEVTTRMLLNHTSGLAFDSPCLNDQNTTITACVQEIAATTLSYAPGTGFVYSGAGYQVAGLVAEQVAGKSWAELFSERISTPLQMATFNFGPTQNPFIGGGAVSTALDYQKLLQLFLDGGLVGNQRVLSENATILVRSSQIAGLPKYYTPAPADSGLNGYSFGWWISDMANHPGSIGPELSDGGAFGTTPWMDFDRRYAASLLINSDVQHGMDIWHQVRPIILQQINTHGLPDEPES